MSAWLFMMQWFRSVKDPSALSDEIAPGYERSPRDEYRRLSALLGRRIRGANQRRRRGMRVSHPLECLWANDATIRKVFTHTDPESLDLRLLSVGLQ